MTVADALTRCAAALQVGGLNTEDVDTLIRHALNQHADEIKSQGILAQLRFLAELQGEEETLDTAAVLLREHSERQAAVLIGTFTAELPVPARGQGEVAAVQELVEAGRLERSLSLSVFPHWEGAHQVIGGREEHYVTRELVCDCVDHTGIGTREGVRACKHVLAVLRSQGVPLRPQEYVTLPAVAFTARSA